MKKCKFDASSYQLNSNNKFYLINSHKNFVIKILLTFKRL